MQQPLYLILASMLLFAPLFRAGNVPLALLVLQLLSFAAAYLVLSSPKGLLSSTKAEQFVAAALLIMTLLFLLPIPMGFWEILPGRSVYAPILNETGYVGWLSLSLIPQASEYAFWALIPPVVVYFGVINQSRANVTKLVYLVIGMAVFQSVLGMMQMGAGGGSPLYLGNTYADGFPTGTYLNRDHLAGFLEMVFPVVLGLLAVKIGQKSKQARRRSNWRSNLDFLSTVKGHQAFVYGAIGVLLILTLIFTRSRMAIILVMVGLFFVIFAYSRRLGGDNIYGTYGSVIAVIVVLAIQIGLLPVLDRFSMDTLEDLRWTVYATAMTGVGDFFPLGSGPGTFPDIYPIYQPQDFDKFVNRAHNDYLEYLFDGGILVLGLIALGLLLILKRWSTLWISGKWGVFRFMQVGAGIGIFLLILHSVIDFNLHKPANAIYFAFFLAVFMKPNTEEERTETRKPRRRATRRLPEAPAPVGSKPVTDPAVAPTSKTPDFTDW